MVDLVGTRTLSDLLLERAEASPRRTALVVEDDDGSVVERRYEDLVADVRELAAGFAGIGVDPGDRVMFLLDNGEPFVRCWYALTWLGAVPVPVNTASTPTELRSLVEHANVAVLVTTQEHVAVVDEMIATGGKPLQVLMDRDSDERASIDDLPRRGAMADPGPTTLTSPAQVLYTSGSTAGPKGVVVTHANCLHSGERVARTVALQEGERCLTALPLFHVNAQSFALMAALTVGGTAIIVERYRATRFWGQVRRHRATMTSLVAMQLRTLLAQPAEPADADHRLRRLVYAINVSDDERAAFESRFRVRLLNGYGLTEAMTMVTLAPVHGPSRWPSIGLPATGRELQVTDDQGHEVPVGQVGEIRVRGEPGITLMAGYLDDPEATRDALREGWLCTGDTGYLDEHGYLYFFDRRKDVLKRAGENISASEVERVLTDHPQVAEAAVIGLPDPIRDEAVKAFVVPAGGGVDVDAVLTWCRERLSSFKVPTEIEVVMELPRTSVGKVAKNRLRESHRR